MSHREVFDQMIDWYAEAGGKYAEGRSFTEWLQGSNNGKALLAEIDLLDAPPPFQEPEARDMLAERVDALQSAVTLWADRSEMLFTRVGKLERLSGQGDWMEMKDPTND